MTQQNLALPIRIPVENLRGKTEPKVSTLLINQIPNGTELVSWTHGYVAANCWTSAKADSKWIWLDVKLI